MKRPPSAAVVTGDVVHMRLRPTTHKLRYRVFSLLLDVDGLRETANRSRLFSVDRFNLLSIKQRDHGFRDGRSISQFAWTQMHDLDLAGRVERIDMLFYPRILGFAFNPLTVYIARSAEDEVVAMIYEVRNTFGENLTYVLPAGPGHDGTYTQNTPKRFYVSPFNNVEGDYTFHWREENDELTVGVALKTDGKPLLRTHFKGSETPLTNRSILSAWMRHPMMTLKVVAAIHWEAAKLWRKGLRMKDRPPAPEPRIVVDA